FVELLERVRMTILEGMSYQELPYHVATSGSFMRNSLRPDENVFQMLTEPLDGSHGKAAEFRGLAPDVRGRFDLEMALMAAKDHISIKLYYSTDRLRPEWASAFLSAYLSITTRVVSDCARPLSDL